MRFEMLKAVESSETSLYRGATGTHIRSFAEDRSYVWKSIYITITKHSTIRKNDNRFVDLTNIAHGRMRSPGTVLDESINCSGPDFNEV